MGDTVCFSLAPVLRCVGLPRLTGLLFLIPSILGALVSVIFLFIRSSRPRDASRTRDKLLLAGEGIVYFILTLLEWVAHSTPRSVRGLTSFRGFDITIGTTSFLPVLLYVLFLFLFVRSALLPDLPVSFRRYAFFTLAAFIPAIIAINEISSFIGVAYQMVYIPDPTSAVGFANAKARDTWTFFNSLTLALLTAYQALTFCLAFYRLILAFVDQRRIETSHDAETNRHLFRGLGWMCLGIKLGAVETVIGFADGGFGMAVTRRSLRLVSRLCLMIGSAKGLDGRDDLKWAKVNGGGGDRDGAGSIRSKISNPRHSTFVHLGGDGDAHSMLEKSIPIVVVDSPTEHLSPEERIIGNIRKQAYNPFATAFPANIKTTTAPDAVDPFADPASAHMSHGNTFQAEQERFLVAHGNVSPTLRTARPAGDGADRTAQRVTVHYDRDSGKAPHLEVRFSAMGLPSPSAIAASFAKFESAWRPLDKRRASTQAVPSGERTPVETREARLPRTLTLPAKHARGRSGNPLDTFSIPNPPPMPPMAELPMPMTRSMYVSSGNDNPPDTPRAAVQNAAASGSAPTSPLAPLPTKRHSRSRTLDEGSVRDSMQTLTSPTSVRASRQPYARAHPSHMSVMSGMSYATDASDFGTMSEITSRFPSIPPLPSEIPPLPTRSMPVSPNPPRAEPAPPTPAMPQYAFVPQVGTPQQTPRAFLTEHGLDTGSSGSFWIPSMSMNAGTFGGITTDDSRPTTQVHESLAIDTTSPIGGADADDEGSFGSALSDPRSHRSASEPDVPRSAIDAPELVDVPLSARPGLPRVKSVGHAPQRRTPLATPPPSGHSRESVPVEHFVFEMRRGAELVRNVETPSSLSSLSPDDERPRQYGFAV